ncbi:FAD-binding oxidoreductase [Legionella clemsonensis]|uniref:Putative decaprenylphosphoryl-beta-D-ribose oxidase n=1 Tax=Legionella clemsonensis TaxID=1867846 RepID=A0A222P0P6_9GAMM|nr:FAD-binding oxidoreductase [Legionella clemsonensis]ASQ45365.1 putative decaprenylphosphoryl-beta-D-ribose oxidase [Legionella clemsonensis]
MLGRTKKLSNFSNSVKTNALCLRPDTEAQVAQVFTHSSGLLARGQGSSYGDCCVNHEGVIVDTTRLNHLISFDDSSGILIAQGGVKFSDLFSVSPRYVPPVIPGTLRATLAGGVANDIHGKNNHYAGSFGQHLAWLELQLGAQTFICSPQKHSDLFYATIGGLGLTGIIKRVAIKMRKAHPFVITETEKHTELASLLKRMQSHGLQYDYQVAWLDLLNQKHYALLSLANHTEETKAKSRYHFTIPKIPLRLVNRWNMKLFNRYYFKSYQTKKRIIPLYYFNNPLDTIRNWNRLYGKKGLLQFQAVFDTEKAEDVIERLLTLITTTQATPTLAVLKYFTQQGCGLLSFTQPGFTLAVDFINNSQAQTAIRLMNEYITEMNGKSYLAKDLLLTPEQFRRQYPHHEEFIDILAHYKSAMCSDLSKRLGITS